MQSIQKYGTFFGGGNADHREAYRVIRVRLNYETTMTMCRLGMSMFLERGKRWNHSWITRSPPPSTTPSLSFQRFVLSSFHIHLSPLIESVRAIPKGGQPLLLDDLSVDDGGDLHLLL